MQNDANVVHLTRVASEPSPNAGAGRLPVILVQVRDKAALQLKQALQALFDNADDTLFEMADRATSNLEQNAFFEAMRDLRLKRKSIERVYLQKVFEEFSALNQVQSGKSVPTLDTVSFDSLSLVQNEELEESVAVDAMVARVMSRDASALAHLSTRLNTLVGRKVDEKSNPLAPRPLTAAFLDACQGLGVEIKGQADHSQAVREVRPGPLRPVVRRGQPDPGRCGRAAGTQIRAAAASARCPSRSGARCRDPAGTGCAARRRSAGSLRRAAGTAGAGPRQSFLLPSRNA